MERKVHLTFNDGEVTSVVVDNGKKTIGFSYQEIKEAVNDSALSTFIEAWKKMEDVLNKRDY